MKILLGLKQVGKQLGHHWEHISSLGPTLAQIGTSITGISGIVIETSGKMDGYSGFNYQDIHKLNELLGPEDQEAGEQHTALTDPGKAPYFKSSDSVAKPFAPVTTTINNRRTGDTASKKENVVWEPNEVKDLPVEKNESRPRPEFEIVYKQQVGTEDVYLGMSNKDPSSVHCQSLVLKIKLPGTKLAEISCDVNPRSVLLQTPKHFLHHHFNHEVKDKDAKAKWVNDKEELHVEVPVIPYLDF